MKFSFRIIRFRDRRRLLPVLAATLILAGLCLWHDASARSLSLLPVLIPALPLISCLQLRIDRFPAFALVHGVLAAGLSVLYLYYTRRIWGASLSDMYWLFILMNLMLFWILAGLFYVLSGSSKFAYGFTLTFLLFAELANRFVYQFRASEITPMDLLSLRTTFNVAASYKLTFQPAMIEAVCVFFFVICCLCFVLRIRERFSFRIAALVLTLAASGGFCLGLGRFDARYWDNEGALYLGFPVNFLRSAMDLTVKEPENYDALLKELEKTYPASRTRQDAAPNIIIIMNESFADLRVFGEDACEGQEITPFFDSLTENAIRGFALSSVYGGNTPNSEWELLTGNSMLFLPRGIVPFNTYAKADTSQTILWELQNQGYRCEAMHPYYSSGWSRKTVYPLLGFQDSRFLSGFPQEKLVRDFVSDEELYDQLIQRFEEKAPGEKLCLYAISMQNHGGYSYQGDRYTQTVFLDKEFPDDALVEQYLSLLRLSDQALEALIDYFRQVPEDTVILFFGDHQPGFSNECLEALAGRPLETLADTQRKYMVPFFVWANFDIPEEEVACTSLNYLSGYLYRAAGLTPTGYGKFLEDLESVIPAINAFGFYSPSAGDFLEPDDAEGAELDMLNRYQCLQYNNVFRRKSGSPLFANRLP